MGRRSVSALLALILVHAHGNVATAGFVVDGRLSDWGAVVADNNGSNLNSYQLGTPGVIGFHAEDQNDNAGDSFVLGPNQGGQNYDAEFLGVAREAGKLFITVVTGQRPDNGFNGGGKGLFGPGDLRLNLRLNGQVITYGIEVGGGPVNASSPTAVLEEGGAGATYLLDSSGYTIGHTSHASGQVTGSLWLAPSWINDPIAPQGPTQMQMAGGTFVGMADYFYTLNSFTTQHAIIELSLDESLFGGAEFDSAHWRPSCGNDELDVQAAVPAPPAVVLAGIGMVWVVGYAQWRRRRGRSTCS